MLILVTLPPWPRRSTPGQLKLFSGADTTGIVLYSCLCLGMSDHYMASRHGNPTGNPLFPFGDTPTGGYNCNYMPVTSMPGYDPAQFEHSYGPNGIVSMVGVEGQALAAYRAVGWPGQADYKPARSGIDIHGGAPLSGTKTGLRVTDGCIRVTNQDMLVMAGYFVSHRGEGLRCIVGEAAGKGPVQSPAHT